MTSSQGRSRPPSPSGVFIQPDLLAWLEGFSAPASLSIGRPGNRSAGASKGLRLIGQAYAGRIAVLRLEMIGGGRLQLQTDADSLLLLFQEKGAFSGSCGGRALAGLGTPLVGSLFPRERLDLISQAPATSLLCLRLPHALVLQVMDDFCKPPLTASLIAELGRSLQLALLPMVEAFLRRTATPLDPRDRAVLAELETTVLYSFIRLIPDSGAADRRPSATAPSEDLELSPLQRAERFMRQNLHRPLNLDDLAEACGCSKRNLQLLFRKECDATPMQRLRQLRLEVMHRQLQLGARVQESCRTAGLPASGRASDLYRQMYGETPSETRAAAMD